MPSRNHLVLLARQLRGEVSGHAFHTIERVEITKRLREISGEDNTRIKSGIAWDLERALLEQGLRCFPSLSETTTGDTVRLFHTPSVLGNVIDVLVYPSRETDKNLGEMLMKIKGKWEWSTPAPAPPAPEAVTAEPTPDPRGGS